MIGSQFYDKGKRKFDKKLDVEMIRFSMYCLANIYKRFKAEKLKEGGNSTCQNKNKVIVEMCF